LHYSLFSLIISPQPQAHILLSAGMTIRYVIHSTLWMLSFNILGAHVYISDHIMIPPRQERLVLLGKENEYCSVETQISQPLPCAFNPRFSISGLCGIIIAMILSSGDKVLDVDVDIISGFRMLLPIYLIDITNHIS
jgi:hypothetical protein